MSDIFGKSSETNVNYLPQQIKDIEATSAFKTGTVQPYWQNYVNQLNQAYGESVPGIYKAAQGISGYGGQMAETLGETGESAARTGVSGLESFFNPQYGQEQFAAAMAPIQAQYQQNLANQGAQFGGAGQLGSARQALAGTQLAGATQAAQMQAAANVMNQLNQQRLQAGQALGSLGGNYLTGGLTGAQARYGAATAPAEFLTKTLGAGGNYVPTGTYTPPYPGTQSTSSTQTPSLFDIGSKVLPFLL